MTCRSGCPDGPDGHASWGACARAAHTGYAYISPDNNRSREKAFQKENDYYASAVKAGLNPAGVERSAVDAAYKDAERE